MLVTKIFSVRLCCCHRHPTLDFYGCSAVYLFHICGFGKVMQFFPQIRALSALFVAVEMCGTTDTIMIIDKNTFNANKNYFIFGDTNR